VVGGVEKIRKQSKSTKEQSKCKDPHAWCGVERILGAEFSFFLGQFPLNFFFLRVGFAFPLCLLPIQVHLNG